MDENISHDKDDANQVLKLEPEAIGDVWDVAIQALRERRAVILSTRRMASPDAQRAVDFLAGATQIVYGHVESLGDGIFLFTPSTASVRVWGTPSADKPRSANSPGLLGFLKHAGSMLTGGSQRERETQ
eukprot:jgi/Chlat1/7311/Chrsp58S06934